MKSYLIAMAFFIFSLFSATIGLSYEYTPGVSLSLSEEYNDNIFLTHVDRDGDFITHISPGIDLLVRSLNSELKLGYSPTFSIYKSHEELNETSHRFTADGRFTLSERMSLTLADTFLKSSETTDIRSIPDLGPLIRRTELRLHTANGSMSYRLRGNLSYIIGASYSDADFKEPGFSESKSYSGNMGLTYGHSERTTLSANIKYIKYDFRPGSDGNEQDYTLGVIHRVTPTFTVGLTGGVINIKIEDTGRTDTDFSGGIDLTKIFGKGEAVLSYRKAVIAGIEAGAPLKNQTVSLRLSGPITNEWAASVSAAYSKFKSVGITNVNTDEVSFGTDLTYNLRPSANLVLSYRYINSDDKLTGTRDYYNNIVFLTLRLSYSRRL